MPCLAVHLAIAKKYVELHPEENEEEFIKGSMAPDIAEDKNKAHYGSNEKCEDIIEYMQKKTDLKAYLNENKLDTSFNRAYFLHLLADYLFFGKYVTSDLIKGLKTEEVVRRGYNDYDIITPIIIKKWGLDIPEYLPDKVKEFLSRNKEGKLELISEDTFDLFVNDVASTDIFKLSEEILSARGK